MIAHRSRGIDVRGIDDDIVSQFVEVVCFMSGSYGLYLLYKMAKSEYRRDLSEFAPNRRRVKYNGKIRVQSRRSVLLSQYDEIKKITLLHDTTLMINSIQHVCHINAIKRIDFCNHRIELVSLHYISHDTISSKL